MIIPNNIEYTRQTGTAHKINGYFTSRPERLKDNLPEVETEPLSSIKVNEISSLNLYPVSKKECGLKLRKTVRNTDSKTILRKSSGILAPIIAKLMNLFFKSGTFPSYL